MRCVMYVLASRLATDRSVRLPDEVDVVVGESAHAGRDCAVVACDSFQVRIERLESFRHRTALREPPPVVGFSQPELCDAGLFCWVWCEHIHDLVGDGGSEVAQECGPCDSGRETSSGCGSATSPVVIH